MSSGERVITDNAEPYTLTGGFNIKLKRAAEEKEIVNTVFEFPAVHIKRMNYLTN